MITNEIRQKRVSEISEETFTVYTSAELTSTIKKCLLTYHINEKDAFIDLIGDTLITLLPRNTFEQSLVSEIKLTPDVARAVAQEFKTFFDKADGTPHTNALETKERLELRPQVGGAGDAAPATPQQPTPEDKGAAKPLTREELMNALMGKRTMAQDIALAREKQNGGGGTTS